MVSFVASISCNETKPSIKNTNKTLNYKPFSDFK